jgi:poly-gamma-glutamate synthesis protein (capsule biosynthesis protein)
VPAFGAGRDLDEAFRVLVAEVRGIRLGFLGISCTLPPGSAATDRTPGVAPVRIVTEMEVDGGLLMEQPGSAPLMHTRAIEQDVERAQEAVRAATRQADQVIVMIHWGVPPASIATFYGQYIADYQPPLGRALIEAGAHAVVGHHPHVLHGIEVYRGCPIVYSLGNLVFEAPPSFMSDRGLLLDLRIGADGIQAVNALPLQLTANGVPRTATPAEARQILDDLEALSADYGTRFERDAEGTALRVVLE